LWNLGDLDDDRDLGRDAGHDAAPGREDRKGFERDGIQIGDRLLDRPDVHVIDESVQEVVVQLRDDCFGDVVRSLAGDPKEHTELAPLLDDFLERLEPVVTPRIALSG
jgi:hypothetical protein